MSSEPASSAASVAHALHVEHGGSRMEVFCYGWCPCGWIYHADAIGPGAAYMGDRIKQEFAYHLEALHRD